MTAPARIEKTIASLILLVTVAATVRGCVNDESGWGWTFPLGIGVLLAFVFVMTVLDRRREQQDYLYSIPTLEQRVRELQQRVADVEAELQRLKEKG